MSTAKPDPPGVFLIGAFKMGNSSRPCKYPHLCWNFLLVIFQGTTLYLHLKVRKKWLSTKWDK